MQYCQHPCSEKIRVSSERPEQIFMVIHTALLGCIRRSVRKSREGTLPLCSAMVKPHLEYCAQFWASQSRRGMDILEAIQWKATKNIKGSKHFNCEEELSYLGLFSLVNKRLRRYKSLRSINQFWKYPKEGWKYERGRLFSVASGDRNRGSRHKLKHRRVQLNINPFFTVGWPSTRRGCHKGCGISILEGI